MSPESEQVTRCPSWCERDTVYQPLPEIDPGAREHTRLVGLVQGVNPTNGKDAMVVVQLSQYVPAEGPEDALKVDVLGLEDGGEWYEPGQLRHYAAALMAAADELEAALSQ